MVRPLPARYPSGLPHRRLGPRNLELASLGPPVPPLENLLLPLVVSSPRHGLVVADYRGNDHFDFHVIDGMSFRQNLGGSSQISGGI